MLNLVVGFVGFMVVSIVSLINSFKGSLLVGGLVALLVMMFPEVSHASPGILTECEYIHSPALPYEECQEIAREIVRDRIRAVWILVFFIVLGLGIFISDLFKQERDRVKYRS